MEESSLFFSFAPEAEAALGRQTAAAAVGMRSAHPFTRPLVRFRPYVPFAVPHFRALLLRPVQFVLLLVLILLVLLLLLLLLLAMMYFKMLQLPTRRHVDRAGPHLPARPGPRSTLKVNVSPRNWGNGACHHHVAQVD